MLDSLITNKKNRKREKYYNKPTKTQIDLIVLLLMEDNVRQINVCSNEYCNNKCNIFHKKGT